MGRKKNSDIVNVNELKIDQKIDIDYKKLADAIIAAHHELEKERIALQTRKDDEARQQRKKTIGLKDYSNVRNWPLRKVKEFLNAVCVIVKILFIKKEDAKNLSGTNMLFQGITELFFAFIRYGLYIATAILVVRGIVLGDIVLHIVYAIAAFLYAQIFRLAQWEMARMKDREYIMAVFAAILSVLSLIISLILR